MTAYPYTYLASFMNPDFQQAVVALALKNINAAGGAAKQRLDRAVRSAGVSAPGYRPGKIPLHQLAKPLVTPVSRSSPLTPFTSNEDIAYAILALWVESKSELRAGVAAFLEGKGMLFKQELPPGGFPDTMTTSEMEALAGELGASSDADSDVYDETALMLVCLLGRAPVPDAEEPPKEPEDGELPAA